MDLQLDRLQSLYDHIRSETVRVKIELEVPDAEGQYLTTVYDYIEKIPQLKMSNFERQAASKQVKESDIAKEDAEAEFRALAAELAKLPRITREFFSVLIERRDIDRRRPISFNRFRINTDRLDRISSSYPDMEGELRILQAHNFIRFVEPSEPGESAHWELRFPGTSDYFHLMVDDFLREGKLSWRRPIVHLDFSDF